MRTKNTRSGKGQARRTKLTHSILETLESRQLLSTYYVSPSGSDAASGALDAPWKSVQHALDSVASGDTINLRAGTYSGNLRIRKANITLQSYGSERASIASPTTNSAIQSTITFDPAASGGKLINLDISGGYYYAIKTESTWSSGAAGEYGARNILIQGCKLHDSGRDVVKLVPLSDNITIERTEIYNSGRRDASNAEGIDGVNVDNFILRDSYVHDTTTNGVYLKGGSINTLIERNRISNTAHSGIILGQSTDDEFFNSENTSYYESIDGTVRNNVIWNIQGAGVAAWAALRGKFYNNTMVDVAKSMMGGILITSEPHAGRDVPSTDITLANNIVVVNSSRPAVDIRAGGLTGTLTTSNNRYYKSGGTAQFWDERSELYGNLTQWKAKFGDAGSSEGDPRVDAANNYHLFADSPAINAGKTISGFANDFDLQARPSGSAWDIGADEYGGTPSTQPPPVQQPTEPPPTTSTPTWQNQSFSSQSGEFIVEFDAKPSAANSDVVIGLSNGSASSFANLAAIVRFNSSNTIDARNGGSYAAQNTVRYSANTSYHFKLVVRTAQRTYDVYVTPQGGTPVLLGQNYAFRSEQSGVSTLNNWAKYNEVGNATVTNFKTAVPTPTPVQTPTWENHALTSQSGNFTVEFDAKPTQAKADVIIGLSNGTAGSYTHLAAIARFNASNTIDARNGSAYAARTSVPYVANASYHFKMVVRTAQRTYDIYVTPPGGTPILLGQNYAFRSEQSTVSGLNNWAKYNEVGNATVSNFRLATASTTPTTPTATTNVAAGRPAVASSVENSTLAAAHVTDGSTTTRWSSAASDNQWIYVDLGKRFNIGRVALNWEYASARAYQIQVSDDAANWRTIHSTTSGDGGVDDVSGLTGTGRYVRILGTQRNTSFGYSLWEMSVYGTPA